MREVNDMVTIYGGAVIAMDRPAYQVETVAQEIAEDIRTYATLYSPTNVRDWAWCKQTNGQRVLDYVKVIDESYEDYDVVRCWHPDMIEVYTVQKGDAADYNLQETGIHELNNVRDSIAVDYGKILNYTEYENTLGYVPFIFVQTDKSFHKGIGTSAIGDVADLQREIYNLTSELYQTIRLSSHPSVVAEPAAEISGGAGAIITIPEDTNNVPFLLQPTGASVDGILKSIQQKVDAIDELSHLTAIKAKKGPQSGISLQVEKEMLNAKLADTAGVLEAAEKKIWKMWFDLQGIEAPEEFYIEYEKKFDLRDKHQELSLYASALAAVPHDSFKHYMHDQIARLMIDDESDLQIVLDSIAEDHANMNVVVPGTNES